MITHGKCAACHILFKEKDRVRFEVEADYHVLGSAVTYSFYPNTVRVTSPIVHLECPDEAFS